ncbi:XRE family transcriptional regulator [Mannheimia varigena]|uniref:XRE family transcriptional regulator n=1 Tax=Mannheimia varigena TaxID=85404 RepID=UPI000DBF0688|nr:XRE family transcriptional regulator [Mannheimia varigena]AWW34712.1 XRE family transcriptional regulator [Mannheimia varigena]
MTLYHFSILIRDTEKTTENLEDRLFEAGCDDALICFYNQSVYLEFDREAETAHAAIQSAIENIRQAGFSDLVLQEAGVSSLSEIAARTGLTRAAISNYANGKRAKDFPKPLYGVASGSALYSWKEVANWLYQHKKLSKAQWEVAECM